MRKCHAAKNKGVQHLLAGVRSTNFHPFPLSTVKTTPQMTRFCDVKVCNILVTDEIDDLRIQSDYKCTIGLQYPEGKNSTLGIAYAW